VRVAWPYSIGFLAEALLEQGDTDEAARVIDQGDFPEQLPLDQAHLAYFRLYRGRLRIESGSPERGVEELLQVGESARLVPFDNPSDLPWRSWAAEGLRRLDRNDEARALAAEELALARRWGESGCSGRRSRCSPARKLGSSTRAPSSTSAQRSAAPTSGPRHASGSGKASSSREGSELGGW
jgi:hypothetical protein